MGPMIIIPIIILITQGTVNMVAMVEMVVAMAMVARAVAMTSFMSASHCLIY